MKTKRILTANLKPGMMVSEAAYTTSNHLVVQSNTALNDEIIEKLKYYSIKSVKVYIQDSEESSEKTATVQTTTPEVKARLKTNKPTYFERIQNSTEFKKFDAEFSQSVDNFRQSLNDIVTKSTDGLVDSMLNDVKNVVSKTRNPLHLLDMMQCMRGYDDMTYTHSMNVALICDIIGTWIGINKDDLNVLITCGMLHDIGKLRVPPDIIQKPGKLTPAEYDEVKHHPTYGYEILSNKNLDRRVKLAAYQHHERFDGSGYPNHLVGKDIEYFSSIVAIADVYDAMTANRVYRKGICPFPVIELMEKERELYEPSILCMFMERTIEAYINTNVLLSNGVIGTVVLLNKSAISRPIIIGEDNKTYDLSKMPHLQIETIV